MYFWKAKYLKMYRGVSFLISLSIVIYACSPKVQETLVPEPAPVPPVEEIMVKQNPCTQLSDLTGAMKEQTENAYVIYKDYVKLKKFKEAYPIWRKAYYGAPAANGSIKYQFEDGIAIYKNFYETTNDTKLKASYIDTIMMIYDKRVECFGEPSYVAGRKAFDYYYSFRSATDIETIYSLFKEAIDGKGEKADYFIINPFTKILSDKIANEELSLEEGRKYAKLLWRAIDYGTNSGKNKEAWAIINEYAPPRLEALEGVKALYDCEYYTKKYYALFEANPDSCEIINRAYGRLLWGACGNDNPGVQALKAAKEEKCYTPPPPAGPLRQAFDAYTEGNYNGAIKLFEEFVELTSDAEKKFKYSLLIAKIYYGDIRNFPKSREYALKASNYKQESGEPYLLIGKLYASSGPLCGPGRGWDSQIVTWPAIDMFEKAAKDPLVAAEARKLIRTYWQYMPSREDIFSRTIKEGSNFFVGCWIQRNTTVRTP